jgi:hypothetical protein
VAQTTGGMVGISDGLHAGQIVVTDGQDKLQDGTKVVPNAAPAGSAAATVPSPNTAPSSIAAPAPGAVPQQNTPPNPQAQSQPRKGSKR